MSVPLNWYIDPIDRTELEKRFNRDAADLLSEAIDGARIALTGFFCGDAAPEIDANGAEQAIHRAFEPLEILFDAFERKGGRA